MSQEEIDAITESGGPKPQFAGNEILTATNLNLATRHWVTTEVPGDHLGSDGDIAFVAGGFSPNSQLPGLGGWATIKEVSGTFIKHTYGDWVAYQWTDDGSINIDEGLVDVLLVGGGHSGYIALTDQVGPGDRGTAGNGGNVTGGLYSLPQDISLIDVGKGYKFDYQRITKDGEKTQIDTLVWEALGGISSGWGHGGAGAGGTYSGNEPGPGIFSSITGEEEEYGRGGYFEGGTVHSTIDKYGWGGCANPWNNPGGYIDNVNNFATSGTAIIRVPAANAQNVIENYYRWISYATVENGVVTNVTKTPDNQPYTASAQEVECDASVQEGYLYENGEFTAPKPDYSDEIEALTARLEALRNV